MHPQNEPIVRWKTASESFGKLCEMQIPVSQDKEIFSSGQGLSLEGFVLIFNNNFSHVILGWACFPIV